MWYRQSNNFMAGLIPDVKSSYEDPALDLPGGINGPADEKPQSVDENDNYAVGKTRAVEFTDEILQNPAIDAYSKTLEEKLQALHQEPMNRTSKQLYKSKFVTVNLMEPYQGGTLEEALETEHRQSIDSIFSGNRDAPTVHKSNNSAFVAKSYDNGPGIVPSNRPGTQYSW
jgi:hypothetical protein